MLPLVQGWVFSCISVQALEARRQGKALPLKDFHNDIKRKMINRWALMPVLQASWYEPST